jgi:hypothetical protein
VTPVLAVDAVAVLVGVETLVVVLLCVIVAGLLRSHATILRRLHELGAGVGDPSGRVPADGARPFQTAAGVPSPPGREGLPAGHDVSGTGPGGEAVAVRVVGAQHDTLLAFLSSSCLTCQRFWSAFAEPGATPLPEGTRLVVVTKDPADETPGRIAELAPPGVTLAMSSAAWTGYGVPGSPYFVLVDGPTGEVVGEGTGLDWAQVANLLAQATNDLTWSGGPGAAKVDKASADAEREARVDQELMAAGVYPGDPSLFPAPAEPDPDRPGAPGRTT